SRVAHPHPPLRRHHPEIARRLRRSLRRPQARPPRRTAPSKSPRPRNRPRTARPPLPAPEKYRRDLLPRAPRRSGNLRVPAGPPVTPMRKLLSGIRLCLVHPSAARTLPFSPLSPRSPISTSLPRIPCTQAILNRLLRVFLRPSASPRQNHSLPLLIALSAALA